MVSEERPEPLLEPELELVDPLEPPLELPLALTVPDELEDPELAGALFAAVAASAGSWPLTSWTKISPHSAMNSAAPIPTARTRIR